jgi:tetratricopeptide (TPR) repeat protein
MKPKTLHLLFFAVFGIFAARPAAAQMWQQPSGNVAAPPQIDRGIELYGDGRWGEAIVQFRRAQQETGDAKVRAEAQFWIAISELSAGQYLDSIHDFDEVVRIDPLNVRRSEIPYHKGRAFYYLGRYNEAIGFFAAYADSIRIDGRYINGVRMDGWNSNGIYDDPEGDYNSKAAALFWIGECYYSLGDMKNAEELFKIVVADYRHSHKFSPSESRLALIKQKKVESELLDILRFSTGAGSLGAGTSGAAAAGSAENNDYDDAILAYQKRIAPYLITEAYNQNTGAVKEEEKNPGKKPEKNNPDTIMRLLTIKTTALEMMDRLISTLNSYETYEE